MAGRVLIKGGGELPTQMVHSEEMVNALVDMALSTARWIIKQRDEARKTTENIASISPDASSIASPISNNSRRA